MRKPSNFAALFVITITFLISGCAGQTKPYIPDQIPHIANGMSRIVLTREHQLAGAGSPIIVMDIGKHIEPNSMMYIKGMAIEDILDKENYASIVGVPFDNIFMWFNSKLVKPLYCGDIGDGCIKYHWRWPKKERGGFLYGTCVIIHSNCEDPFGHFENTRILETIMNHRLKTVSLSEVVECSENSPNRDWEISKTKIYSVPKPTGYYQYYALTTLAKPVPTGNRVVRYEYDIIDDRNISRNVQVIGSVEVGDTLIWDRKPGIMRLGAAWWDGVGFMPKNIKVEAGRTYFLHYTTRFLDQRWEIMKVE